MLWECEALLRGANLLVLPMMTERYCRGNDQSGMPHEVLGLCVNR